MNLARKKKFTTRIAISLVTIVLAVVILSVWLWYNKGSSLLTFSTGIYGSVTVYSDVGNNPEDLEKGIVDYGFLVIPEADFRALFLHSEADKDLNLTQLNKTIKKSQLDATQTKYPKSDQKGNYSLELNPGNYIICGSSLGNSNFDSTQLDLSFCTKFELKTTQKANINFEFGLVPKNIVCENINCLETIQL
jgi:hypothetical protein